LGIKRPVDARVAVRGATQGAAGARRTENDLARPLGEKDAGDLRSFASLPGDFTPERRFASTA
jgi:hypothetical protein